MRNRAGIEIAAYPAHAADRVDNAVSIRAAHRRIAVFIQKLRRAVGTNFMRMLAAEGAVYRPAIGQVIFCLRHAELAFNIAIAPLLAVVLLLSGSAGMKSTPLILTPIVPPWNVFF